MRIGRRSCVPFCCRLQLLGRTVGRAEARVKCDDARDIGPAFVYDARDELQQLLVGYVKAVGTHQVKRNEPVVLVQVVDGERGIDLHDAALYPAAQVVAGGGDGVAV